MKVLYGLNLLFIFVLLLMQYAYSNDVILKVEGLSDDLQRNVYARLLTVSTINKVTTTTNTSFQSQVDNAVRKGLRALGYYYPTINFIFKPVINCNSNVLLVTILPGKPVKITGVNVILRGEAQHDSDYLQLVRNGKPSLGTILNHGTYDRFKNDLSKLALSKGYFDAKFCKSQLGIAHYQAYWNIDFDSGQRYRFGDIRFHGTQIREEYLQNLTKLRKGISYSAEFLANLNRQLAATNWFNSVIILPDFTDKKQCKMLSLDIVLTPRTSNNLETDAGYATNVGPRVKTAWNKPWLNSFGHSLQVNLACSLPEQSFDISYKIPLLQAPLEQWYLLQGGFKRINKFNYTHANSTTVNVARYWELPSGWQQNINLRCSLDYLTQANVTDTIMLIYPGLGVNRIYQRGGIMPILGRSQLFSMDISNTIWGSDINYLILQMRNIWIRTLAEKYRFVMRVNLGWIETNNFKLVPLSLRFFAGGDRSIRGYKYKSLSPEDVNGRLIGSSKLATASLEYQYNLANKWWFAFFFDFGEAINNIRESNLKTGFGCGLHWQSPVGHIKFDIASPVADKHKHGVQCYIKLGPEL